MKTRRKGFRSLELTVKKLINNFSSGIHRSYLMDNSGDIDVVREYQPGDKRLDCKSSLRAGKIMSRVFNPEKLISVFIILDISSSGFYGLSNIKIDVGIEASLYLSFLATEAGDSIGLITFDDKVEIFHEPSLNAQNVILTLENLYKEILFGGEKRGTNLELALRKCAQLEISNCLLVVISDFLFPHTSQLIRLLKQFNAGTNNCSIGLVLVNEKEWLLQKRNFTAEVVDAESDTATRINFNSGKLEDVGRILFAEWKKETAAFLNKSRCQPIFIDINHDNYLMPLVRHFLKIQT